MVLGGKSVALLLGITQHAAYEALRKVTAARVKKAHA